MVRGTYQVPSELSAVGAKRGVRRSQLPKWSPPDDPFYMIMMLTTMMKRKEIKQHFLLLCSKSLFMNMVTMTMLNIKRIVIHMPTMLNNNDEKKRKSFLLLCSISYALHGL